LTVPLNGGRRRHLRFPIRVPAQYMLNGSKHFVVTANLSAGGIFLHTEEAIPVGHDIRLWIEWPAKLDGRCPLTLFVTGRVIRRERNGAAVRILKYEFRLRPAPATAERFA